MLTIGNWLFVIGSIIFTCDSVSEILEGLTLRSIEHFSASLLFTAGSVLFLLESTAKKDTESL